MGLIAVVMGVATATTHRAAAQDPTTTTTTTRPESWQGASSLPTTWEVVPNLEAAAITIVDDIVVAATEDGRFAGYDTDGSERWTSSPRTPSGALSHVRALYHVDDLLVVIGNAEGTTVEGSTGSAILALDPATGSTVWTLEPGRIHSPDRAVDGSALVMAYARVATAYDAAGSIAWEREFDEQIRLAGRIDGTVFARLGVQPSSRMIALSIADGSTLWEGEPIGIEEVRVGVDEVIATARHLDEAGSGVWLQDAAVVSFDPTTGEQQWAIATPQVYNLRGWQVLADQLVTVEGSATAHDIGTGGEVWSVSAKDVAPMATDMTAPPVISGDRVLLGAGRYADSGAGSAAVVEVSATGDIRAVLPLDGPPTDLTRVGDDIAATVETADGFQVVAFTPTSAIVADEPEEPDEPEEESSVLLGIPSPEDALTVKNAGLAGALLMLLLVLVVLPSTLFNKALAERLPDLSEHRRNPFERRWIDRGTGTPLRHRWKGLAIYLGVSAAVYSLLEPNWGLNGATAITAVAFAIAIAITTGIEFVSRRRVLRRRFGRAEGHPELWFPSLGIAALCVAGSRAIAFVPGFVYGVVAEFHGADLSDEDEGRYELHAARAMLVIAVAAWFAAAGLGGFGTTGIGQLPSAVAAGIFMAGVETLTVGLLPVALLPGALLRTHHPHWWKALWGTSAFLFCLAMLRPGLVSAQSGSTRWLLAGAAVYGGAAVIYWWAVQRRHGPMVPFPEPTNPTDEAAEGVGAAGSDP